MLEAVNGNVVGRQKKTVICNDHATATALQKKPIRLGRRQGRSGGKYFEDRRWTRSSIMGIVTETTERMLHEPIKALNAYGIARVSTKRFPIPGMLLDSPDEDARYNKPIMKQAA